MKNLFPAMLIFAACLSGQNSPKADAAAQMAKNTLQQGATAGLPMSASINVADNVNVEAVLLPFSIANRVFGKDVAENYAVIEVNISNRSNDAGLIVQSILIDLQDWGFAGPTSSGPSVGGVSRSSQPKPFQSAASPLEVSSVEYRIVRGEMLDRQPNTWRNLSLRSIQALGSIGVAFAFPFTKDVATGIAAWNGAVVPAFQALFPDGLQAQMDRVSDYGFRNNKVIPQQSADILVAFFPIRRFLTPALEDIFKKSPALFFNPILIALDPEGRKAAKPLLKTLLKDVSDTDFENMLKEYSAVSVSQAQYDLDLAKVESSEAAVAADQAAISQDSANKANPATVAQHGQSLTSDQTLLGTWETRRDNDKQALDKAVYALAGNTLYGLLGSLSLNNVHLALRGIMTVDVNNVPGIITSIDCNKSGDTSTLIWAESGDLTCQMHGSFLASGTPVVAEAAKFGLTVGTIATGSTDALLNFKLTLPKPLDPQTPLTFTVTKKNKQGNTVESSKFAFTVPDYVLPAPSITKVDIGGSDNSTVTVTGADFYDTPKSPLTVNAHVTAPQGAKDQPVAKLTAQTLTQLQFEASTFPSGCYQVQVKSGSQLDKASTDKPPKDEFPWFLNAKIDFATLSGSTLTVALDQLFNLPDCGSTLTFRVVSDVASAAPSVINNPQFSTDGKTATLTVPALPSGAKSWKSVEALINGKPMTPAVTASITAK